MGYILALVLLVLLVPLLFVMLTRRTAGGGRLGGRRDRGMTVEQPSSDQPTPGAPRATNQPKAGAENRLPPG